MDQQYKLCNALHVGDKSTDSSIEIVDEDRLCYLAKSFHRGSSWTRTISKQLLQEFVEYFQEFPDNSASDARKDLSGKTGIDKYEYGYDATFKKLAKMVINPADERIRSAASTSGSRQSALDSPLHQIYYGAPGTGKSHAIKQATQGKDVIRTTFHPDTDYATFVGAYKPTMKRLPIYDEVGQQVTIVGKPVSKEQITYEFVPQSFLQAYVAAWKAMGSAGEDGAAPEEVYLVIEEINRGNCAQIFGDIFQLLDRADNGYSEYPIKADADMKRFLSGALAETVGKFPAAVCDEINSLFRDEDVAQEVLAGDVLLLPRNLRIWATMNTSDQSLFPIDSAFKRRWDWTYVPISDAGLGWRIRVGGNDYSWWAFLQAINERIYQATFSEDKQLGYFFCKAPDGVISAERFVSKVVFYLWNDVFKDTEFEGDAFRDGDEGKLTFDKFYATVNRETQVVEAKVVQFLTNLGVEALGESTGDNGADPSDSADSGDQSQWSETEKKRYEYWSAFLNYAHQTSPAFAQAFSGVKKPSKEHWKNFFVQGVDFYLAALQQRQRKSLEVEVCYDQTTEEYHRLFAHKDDIEREMGVAYEWKEKPDQKSSIISEVRANVDFDDTADRPAQFNFLIDRLLRMRDVFSRFAKL